MHIGMAALQEKRTIARRLAAKCMPGCVSGRIGFGLYDAPADAALSQIMDESLTDQELREFECGGWELVAAQAPHAKTLSRCMGAGFFG